jgi:deoxyadenosine/deoxycytidine kinase
MNYSNVRIIAVDGCIGAGKTTLLNTCMVPNEVKMSEDCTIYISFLTENVEDWMGYDYGSYDGDRLNLLDATQTSSYERQCMIYKSLRQHTIRGMQMAALKCKKPGDIAILVVERGLQASKHMSACDFDHGELNDKEFHMLNILYDIDGANSPIFPSKTIYLRTPGTQCIKAVEKRPDNVVTKQRVKQVFAHYKKIMEYTSGSSNSYILDWTEDLSTLKIRFAVLLTDVLKSVYHASKEEKEGDILKIYQRKRIMERDTTCDDDDDDGAKKLKFVDF